MKLSRFTIALSVALACSSAYAQPPGGGRGPGGFQGGQGGPGGFQGGPGGPGGQRGPGGPMPPNPLAEALDADQDGALSLQELTNAPMLLKKFDADKNGKISLDEMRPSQEQQNGRRGGQQNQRGGRPGQGIGDRPEQSRETGGRERLGLGGPEAGGPQGRGPGGPEDRGPGGPGGRGGAGERDGQGGMSVHPERMHAHAMEFDADKDGKLSSEEVQAFIQDFAKVHGEAGPEARGSRERTNGQRGDRPGRRGAAEAGGDRPSRPKA